MDLLSNMLTTLRLDARIFLHSTFCQQWVIDIGAFELATFHLISHGDCWLHLPHTKPVALQEKDLVVLPHNATHLITPSAEPPAEDTPRNAPAGVISVPSVTLICGTVEFSVALPTLFCGHCHCTMCQRNHGAAYVTWFGVP